ncbi:hypothetical protein AB0F20_29820 [Streptomyces goshikiensis]|uniref:hypothetical protein n=1 Tax=Streptomyces goshikiensis TaxID=1942 RepID=UPI0033C5D4E0
MAVLNYRLTPASSEEGRPWPRERGLRRRRTRRWSRREAKRADERLWRREAGETAA